MSRDKSINEKTISDYGNEELFKMQRSEGGTASPYISDLNEIEQPISNNSIESHDKNSDVSRLRLTL